jgi:uncharacterized membrane protein
VFSTFIWVLHVIAGSLWVGGSLLLLLRPVLQRALPVPALLSALQHLAHRFRDIVEIALWVLVVTGVILSFDRLTDATIPHAYVAVLTFKLFLFGWMVLIALNLWDRIALRSFSRPSNPHPSTRAQALLQKAGSPGMQTLLGLAVVILAEVLRLLA